MKQFYEESQKDLEEKNNVLLETLINYKKKKEIKDISHLTHLK